MLVFNLIVVRECNFPRKEAMSSEKGSVEREEKVKATNPNLESQPPSR
jgi:hypothetical protein